MANSKLIVHFLGTGTSQGIPTIGCKHPVCLSTNPKDKRLRSSVLLSKNNQHILIDCGPDFRQQMLRINAEKLDAILYTHEHNDHVLGLDDIRPLVFSAQKNMPLFGQERVLNELKNRFPYVFSNRKYPGVPEVELHPINEIPFELLGFHIEPIAINHGRLPIYGYIIDRKFAYITDAKVIPQETLEKLKNIEVLVLNALRKEPEHFSHFTLDEAVSVAQELNAQQAYFTHISHLMGFHDEVNAELPENISLAYDELILEL